MKIIAVAEYDDAVELFYAFRVKLKLLRELCFVVLESLVNELKSGWNVEISTCSIVLLVDIPEIP